MKIAVIGSTGRTGLHVLREGIRREHAMTAFTRRPEQLAGIDGLRAVIAGDGRNVEDVRRAVRGQDAVISIVAPEGLGATTVLSDVARAEMAAMGEAGVRRLVVVSVYALEGSRPWVLINLVRWILRRPYADFRRMERMVSNSPLDWTIVRPPRLTDRAKTGRVRSEAGVPQFAHGPYHISRSDLAAALLDLAEDTRSVGRTCLVSEARGARRPAASVVPSR